MEAPASIPVDLPFGAYAPTGAQKAIIELTRGTPLRRGTTRRHMAGLVSLLRSGPVDYAFRGANFRLYPKGSATECGMLMNTSYNAEEFALVEAVLAPGDVFVDIGANIGLYSLTLAPRLGPKGVVIAIEPEPASFARLSANVVANDAANVRLFPCAVGDRLGEISFIQDMQNLGHSRVGDGGILVPIQPLAALLAEAGIGRITALKIDVEGFEDRVLMPFLQSWPKENLPRLMVIEHLEKAAWEQDCIAHCLTLGYNELWRGRSNTILERTIS